MDHIWYKVTYDQKQTNGGLRKEVIKLPHKAGWKIVSIKSANWKFMTLVLQEPNQTTFQDYICFFPSTTVTTTI
jgi:hypothetical protein